MKHSAILMLDPQMCSLQKVVSTTTWVVSIPTWVGQEIENM